VPQNNRSIKTGIIGYGYAGRIIHQQLIQATDGLELRAVSTSNPDRQTEAERNNLIVYPNPQELIADPAIELVVIATPHYSHAELSIEALNHGKHVVTDKIMCLTTKEADAMIQAARDNKKMLSVFHNRRWDEDFLTVRKYIGEACVEKPRIIKSYVYTDSFPQPGRWRSSRAKGGGILSDWGAHLIDQALSLQPARVVSVYCDMQYSAKDVDVETWALCVLTFENGTRHIIETANDSHKRLKGWDILGSSSRLVCEGYDPQEAALRRGETIPDSVQQSGFTGLLYTKNQEPLPLNFIPGDWTKYYKNIVQHLLHGEELAVKPEDARKVVQVRELALQSASNNIIIKTSI
jgi:scyllo-inositol 2-dehydrogenase (NADP+)